jgi:hypothetical protein
VKLNRMVNTSFPKIDLIVAFRAPKTIGNLFSFKDKPLEISNIILFINSRVKNVMKDTLEKLRETFALD